MLILKQWHLLLIFCISFIMKIILTKGIYMFKKYCLISTLYIGLFIPQQSFAYTCWDYVGQKFNVDPWLLFSIAQTESTFRNGLKSRNSNGSYDLGLMQINIIHLPCFSKYGLNEEALRYDACRNVISAGSLLRQSINKYGYNIDGIGGYHSNTPHLRRAYGKRVIENYNHLVNIYFIHKEPFSFERHHTVWDHLKRTTPPLKQQISIQQPKTIRNNNSYVQPVVHRTTYNYTFQQPYNQLQIQQQNNGNVVLTKFGRSK